MIATLLVSGLVIGFLIGSVGVGGIILVPILIIAADMPVHQAIATALFSFVFTGCLGSWLFIRQKSVSWQLTLPVCLGSVGCSYVGALASEAIPAWILFQIIAAILIFAAAFVLRANNSIGKGNRLPAVVDQPGAHQFLTLLGIGSLAGFGAGLSGAGGPLFSVPLMMALRFKPLLAIGTGQLLQIFASISGSLRFIQTGHIEYTIAATITVSELIGVVIGSYVSHKVEPTYLRYLVIVICLVCAGFMVMRRNYQF